MNAIEALRAAPAEVRTVALALLDQVSAPLTERQLSSALRSSGIGALEARRIARSLRKLHILAVTRR